MNGYRFACSGPSFDLYEKICGNTDETGEFGVLGFPKPASPIPNEGMSNSFSTFDQTSFVATTFTPIDFGSPQTFSASSSSLSESDSGCGGLTTNTVLFCCKVAFLLLIL